MFKKFMLFTLFFGLFCMADPGEAYAQKGGGSRGGGGSSVRFSGGSGGGVKFSGGGSSVKFSGGGSKPSVGGGSKPSFGGGSKPSVGGGSKPSVGGGSKPSVGGGSTPKFSGGSSTPKVTPGSSGSTPKFSGGGSVSKGSPTDKPKFGGGSTSPPGKVVTTTPIQGKTPNSVSKKPVAESFDKISTTEARKVESRKAYQPAPAPASHYTTPTGKSVPIASGDKSSAYLRGRLDEAHWQTRYQRGDVFYGSYYNRYPMGVGFVYYNDFYHPYWNYWLMGQTLDVMSLWVYHHQLSMDQARLNYMYSQNADLRARVIALERQGIPRDVTYTPKSVDADMMYNDNYVNAVYNPQPKMADHYEYDDEDGNHHVVTPPSSGGGVGHALIWIFVYIPLICLGLFCLYWLVCVKKW